MTSGDIAALRSVGELFAALDQTYGGGHARQALVRYLEHEGEPMLRGSYNEATGRRLFGAVADLTRLAGWTSFDIAAHGLAQRYFVQALRLAQAAGDRTYGSYVLVTMSRQAVYLGHGRRPCSWPGWPSRGSAAAPRPCCSRCCTRSRRAAMASWARCARAPPRSPAPSGRWRRPGRGTGAVLGTALRRGAAGRRVRPLPPRSAAVPGRRPARGALPQLPGAGFARSRLFCRVVLASARLGLGELEQACQLAAEAAQQASEMRSVRAVEYVRDFERRLEPYGDAAPARGYRERVAALG
ncbi:Regulatory protein OS=Streptomyces antimycoticus OX=68175 GN=SANT12839_030750 PE=4 SV=1 [Streptomyces antimycoticus]